MYNRRTVVQFPVEARDFYFLQSIHTGSGALSGYCGRFPWRYSGWGLKLATHLHLVLRLKGEWSYTSTPLHSFMVCQGQLYIYLFIEMEEEVSFAGVLKLQIHSEQKISVYILCACKSLMLSTCLLVLPSSTAFHQVSPPAYKSCSEDLSRVSDLFELPS